MSIEPGRQWDDFNFEDHMNPDEAKDMKERAQHQIATHNMRNISPHRIGIGFAGPYAEHSSHGFTTTYNGKGRVHTKQDSTGEDIVSHSDWHDRGMDDNDLIDTHLENIAEFYKDYPGEPEPIESD